MGLVGMVGWGNYGMVLFLKALYSLEQGSERVFLLLLFIHICNRIYK